MTLKFAIVFLLLTMVLVGNLLYENQIQRRTIASQAEDISGQTDTIAVQYKIIVKQQRIIKKLEEVLDEPDKETEALLAEVQ